MTRNHRGSWAANTGRPSDGGTGGRQVNHGLLRPFCLSSTSKRFSRWSWWDGRPESLWLIHLYAGKKLYAPSHTASLPMPKQLCRLGRLGTSAPTRPCRRATQTRPSGDRPQTGVCNGTLGESSVLTNDAVPYETTGSRVTASG